MGYSFAKGDCSLFPFSSLHTQSSYTLWILCVLMCVCVFVHMQNYLQYRDNRERTDIQYTPLLTSDSHNNKIIDSYNWPAFW